MFQARIKCVMGAFKKFQGCFRGIPRKFKAISMMFKGCFMDVSNSFESPLLYFYWLWETHFILFYFLSFFSFRCQMTRVIQNSFHDIFKKKFIEGSVVRILIENSIISMHKLPNFNSNLNYQYSWAYH